MLVTLEGLVESLGSRSIKTGEIRIEDHPVAADRENERRQLLIAQRVFHVGRSPFAAVRFQRLRRERDDMRYAIVIEKAESNYSAYVPDLPGCVATGDTLEETRREIREAIEFHIEGMREDGLPVPEPATRVAYIEVAA